MDPSDKALIIDNIPQLIIHTTYEPLQHKLLTEGLFFTEIVEYLNSLDPNERHKKLLEEVTRRGPKAFASFCNILLQLKFDHAYRILKPNSYLGQSNQFQTTRQITSRRFTLEPYTEEVESNVRVRKATKFQENGFTYYPMRSRNRGVFFLVNIVHFRNVKPRKGSQADKNNMISLFRQMGFTCFYYEDLTAKELRQLIEKLNVSDYLKTDCFAMTIMTHGNEKKYMEFSDGSVMQTDELQNYFSNTNCPRLINKPKLFFFQFCRGTVPDLGIGLKQDDDPKNYVESDGTSHSNGENNRSISHMLLCYATISGFQAMRDTELGAWYIQSLCHVFAEYAHDNEIGQLLKRTDAHLATFSGPKDELQTASSVNIGFNRDLFFNPGLYE